MKLQWMKLGSGFVVGLSIILGVQSVLAKDEVENDTLRFGALVSAYYGGQIAGEIMQFPEPDRTRILVCAVFHKQKKTLEEGRELLFLRALVDFKNANRDNVDASNLVDPLNCTKLTKAGLLLFAITKGALTGKAAVDAMIANGASESVICQKREPREQILGDAIVQECHRRVNPAVDLPVEQTPTTKTPKKADNKQTVSAK